MNKARKTGVGVTPYLQSVVSTRCIVEARNNDRRRPWSFMAFPSRITGWNGSTAPHRTAGRDMQRKHKPFHYPQTASSMSHQGNNPKRLILGHSPMPSSWSVGRGRNEGFCFTPRVRVVQGVMLSPHKRKHQHKHSLRIGNRMTARLSDD